MSANSSLTLSSLDFDTLKENFKEFLKTQSALKDYNYEGSNINVLLDVMSYNSYLNSFYLNMIASEMFLDSAQKYDSVISHAKELNYTPRSARSAVAEISFTLDTNISGRITIPKGTRFSGSNANGVFNFVTNQTSVYTSGNTTYSVANLQIHEGSYFQDSYIVDYSVENQRFVLSNENIDIDSLTVHVIENNGASNTIFTRATTLFGLNNQSNVYFIQATQTNQYEVVFGDGYFGRKPLNSSSVIVSYVITNGTEGNDIEDVVLNDDLGIINNGTATSSVITLVRTSEGGANQESIDSIRFAAPRYFATQQRAVSSDDYASLVLNKFGGVVSDVAIFGGETVEPKKYGRVIVTVKPSSGTVAPDYIKNEISNYLLDYIALPNRVEIADPDYLFCYISSTVQYDIYSTDKSDSEIQSTVLQAIVNYSSTNLEKFSNDLRYSRLVSAIDNSDVSITSNQTDIRIIKRISPKLNYATSYAFDLNNILYFESGINTTEDHIKLHGSSYKAHFAHASLISSYFTYITPDGVSYPFSYFEDDSKGNILVYTTINNVSTSLGVVGEINYLNGTFSLKDIILGSYDNHVSIYLRPASRDIFANANKIVIIDPNDVSITPTETQR